jgi:hypothetical protein
MRENEGRNGRRTRQPLFLFGLRGWVGHLVRCTRGPFDHGFLRVKKSETTAKLPILKIAS